ncbi:UvrD-helicase domain-containing protein [Tsuneonella sp. HG222]
MDAWSDIRLVARQCRADAVAAASGAQDAKSVIEGMVHVHDLELDEFVPGTSVATNVLGWFERGAKIVHVAKGQPDDERAVVIAHELGHFMLHSDPETNVTEINMLLSGETVEAGAARVDGYSSRERKEVQADVFAGEFLCPSDWLHGRLIGGARPSAVAKELGLPCGLVLQQAIRALLLPPLQAPPPAPTGGAVYDLDDDQKAAASWNGGPLLVHAGPGTGKTRTLIERIRHILVDAEPESVLALTFSNKAAEEMRERLSLADMTAAIEMWVGTFHAFGLELVTRFAGRVGRTADVSILDPTAALALLEANLKRLPLRHYQNLFEPAFELTFVLSAISRAKDELIGPAEYLAAARADLAAAGDDEVAAEAAEKAVEVGLVYGIYEELLEEADAVDFGDLILHAIALLEDPEVRTDVLGRFKHILVDEYQDVNFASSMLLRSLARECEDVWVVADHRQSIYRFRGAEPSNVARFPTEFGGQTLSLGVNYRSGTPVVRTFAAFTGGMQGGAASSWDANRGDLGEVTLEVCPTVDAEACAIRDRIETLRAAGVPYRDQAILARSHLTLGRLTSLLERLDVPLLYLGDLFERDEIRDLLSLVAIDAEFGGIGLVRVAQLPEYGATAEDALAVVANVVEGETIVDALRRANAIEGVSPEGAIGLARLGHQLSDIGPLTTPWSLLTTWLFERSQYLTPLVTSTDPASRQKLIAIYHLLKVCGEHDASGDRSRRRLLARIRRIELLNQDSVYRAISAEATDVDAVRVMTIHGSKGLEFSAVHLPALATRYMPASRQGSRTPPLSAFPQLTMGKEDHEAEEECLFFVGLSRARDYLSLTRAERYTAGMAASASKFLQSLPSVSTMNRMLPSTIPGSGAAKVFEVAQRTTYSASELETFIRCPSRYRYEEVMGLRGGTDASAFLSFHRCVRRTISWIQARRAAGSPANRQEALARLAVLWDARGPIGHGFETYYREAADRMVANAADFIGSETGEYVEGALETEIADRTVTVEPDRLIVEGATVRVQQIRTGRQAKSEAERPIYAVLRAAAARRFPGKAIIVQAFYPSDGEVREIGPAADPKSLKAFGEAIASIEAGALGTLAKERRYCPNCQCYFICGV